MTKQDLFVEKYVSSIRKGVKYFRYSVRAGSLILDGIKADSKEDAIEKFIKAARTVAEITE